MNANEALPIVRKYIDRQLAAEGIAPKYGLYVTWVGGIDDYNWSVHLRTNLPGRYVYKVVFHRVTNKKVLIVSQVISKTVTQVIEVVDLNKEWL